MTSEEKLASVATQIASVRLGMGESIECPYCGSFNIEGKEFCCKPLKQALAAILHREATEELVEMADKISQAASN